MNLLPKASGTRPRVACDISTQGVVAARSDAAGSPLAAVSRVELAAGAVVPGLKPGSEIRKKARDKGMAFLRDSALDRVRQGITTLKEINKVTFIEAGR